MQTIFQKLNIDNAVFFSLLSRTWNVGAGLITLIVISEFLSPRMQGYYYTFNSLIALQVFAELGLNYALVQFASHEKSQLTWHADGTLKGNPLSKQRLKSLVKFALIWLAVAASLMLLLLIPAGLYFFRSSEINIIPSNNVTGAWVSLVILSAANLFIATASAILEGCGRVAQVALMRLCQSILAVSMVWFTLSLGGNLYALPVGSLMMALVGFYWLWLKYRYFIKDLLSHNSHLPGMNWKSEIWPFQWKIALSWACGFFIFQLFNPLIFRIIGPIEAGQMGMTMQIFSAMNGAAIVWVSTKAPTYGHLIAVGQRDKLNKIFKENLLKSSIVLCAGLIVINFILYFLDSINSEYSKRVLTLNQFIFLSFICFINHIVFSEAIYLRAHKEEPFLVLSILNGFATLVLAFWLIPSIGLFGAVLAYGLPAIFISFLYGSYIFFNKKRIHANNLKKETH